MEFNISWLRGGHPLLNVGNLSMEASQSLGLLLDQLRFPTVKSLGNLVIVVLINRYFNYLFSYPFVFFKSMGIMHALSEAVVGVKLYKPLPLKEVAGIGFFSSSELHNCTVLHLVSEIVVP